MPLDGQLLTGKTRLSNRMGLSTGNRRLRNLCVVACHSFCLPSLLGEEVCHIRATARAAACASQTSGKADGLFSPKGVGAVPENC